MNGLLVSRSVLNYLILELMSQRPLAAGTVNEAVRIPGSVTEIV